MIERLLDLLVDEASDSELEQEIAQAAQQTQSPEQREAVRRTGATALRVRATLRDLRRREQELLALNESARDLSALHATEEVLQAIVRRARVLLTSDLAYITLIDEEAGETYMRVCDGALTSDFRRIRLRIGQGLGGLVIKSSMPVATGNLMVDERIVHDGALGRVVAAEGLVAVLGVPLIVDQRVIGVLYAADRRERPFAQQQVALLSSLGAHAAITIEKARLLESSQETLEALRRSSARERSYSHSLERGAEARERLTRVALEGGTLADVAGTLAQLTRAAVTIVDASGALLARAGPAGSPIYDTTVETRSVSRSEPLQLELRAAMAQAQGRGRSVQVRVGEDRWSHWVTPVIARAELIGSIICARQRELDEGDMSIVDNAALVAGLVLINERAVAEAEQRVRGELLSDLLMAPERHRAARQRARLLGYDLDRPHAVVVIDVDALDGRRSAATLLARENDGLVGEHLGRLVFVLPDMSADAAAALVHDRVAGAGSQALTVGAAGPAEHPSEIAGRFREADGCLRALRCLGRGGEWATAASLGLFGMLVDGLDADQLNRLVDPTAGRLLEHDRRHRTALAVTAETFLDHARHLAATARALHIHVNTLYGRLERIGTLLGDGWQQPDRALELHLALRLARLSRQA